MYIFRKGTKDDISQIAQIYDHILTEEESGRTVIGWVRGIYPTAATAEEALRADELFVLEDEGVVQAAARINRIQVPEYANADGEYSDAKEDQIMVLHTLVVEPKSGGCGYGSAFVDFYEKYALEQGCPYLRMDTNEKNAAARRLYARLGYKEIGVVDCEFNGIAGVHLVCLERVISVKYASK